MLGNLSQITVCDVCRLLDYDVSKKLCGYCGMCDAWICQDDKDKWVTRRIPAAAKRMLEPGYKGQGQQYLDQLKEGVK
jgi:hypothetical protein